MGASCVMLARLLAFWCFTLLSFWPLNLAYSVPVGNVKVDPPATGECLMSLLSFPEKPPELLKVGNYRLPTQWFGCYLSRNNTQKACTLNINKLFQGINIEPGLSLFTFDLICSSPLRVVFRRTGNITKSLFISELLVVGPCEISGKDLAVWGRTAGLHGLYLMDGVFVIEQENQTTSDLHGLFNLFVVSLDSLSSPGIPSMFTSFNWTKITQIFIVNMTLTSIPDIWNQTIPNLQVLYLAFNRLTKPPPFPWCSATVKLPSISFGPSNWKSYLTYGEKKSFSPGVFSRSLYIDSNTDLNVSNFEFIPGTLDEISFRGNGLKIINPTIFHKVDKLFAVDLSWNKFKTIPAPIFRNTSGLMDINLAGNSLEFLSTETFQKLGELRKLDLSYNGIQILQNDLFSDLHSLEEIHLENNSLRYIKPGALTLGLLSLNKIYLQRNHLRCIPKGTFLLPNLKVFDMSDNIVTFDSFLETVNSLDIETFKSIHNLSWSEKPIRKIFKLERNEITLSSDMQLDFSKSLNLYWVLVAYTFNMTGNPIICDCSVSGLQNALRDWTTGEGAQIDAAQFDSWVCHSPKDLRGQKLLSVQQELLKCEIQSPKCPADCKCYERVSSFAILVDCRNRFLTKVPEEIPKIPSVELRLEFNEIRRFTFHNSLRNVTILRMSHNNLQRIDSGFPFPSKLNEIFLDSNQLTTLPRDFEKLNLSQIDIQNNSFTCDCKNKWMKTWLLRLGDALDGGVTRVTCSSGKNSGKSLAFVADEDFICPSINSPDAEKEETKLSITAVVYTLGAFLFIVIVLVFMYRFRVELKLLIFTRFYWHPFDRVDDSEPSKIYDAFISYSNRDLEWVMHTLREKLECDDPPYKLCFHHRDFVVGVPISKNIFDSVKASRRMIMVLSKHFIQSEWCMLEFRAAHQQVLRDRTNYLIIVLFDDVDTTEDLDDELKLYLRTNTYLNIHNKWFWEKLKYCLPEKRPVTGPEDNIADGYEASL